MEPEVVQRMRWKVNLLWANVRSDDQRFDRYDTTLTIISNAPMTLGPEQQAIVQKSKVYFDQIKAK